MSKRFRPVGQGPVRIALFFPTLQFGGVEKVMLNLADGFIKRGHAVDLVVANASGAFRDQVPSQARAVDLKARRVLASMPALVRYLRREQPYALIAGMTHCSVVAAWARWLARAKTQVIATEHSLMSSSWPGSHRLRARAVPLFARLFLPWCDEVVAVSIGVADDVSSVARICRDDISVINNPVIGPELFTSSRAVELHPWLKPGEPPLIVSIGRLIKQKGYADLLRAFSLVAQQREARLLILGEGEGRGDLEELVRTLGLLNQVGMPGFQANPYAYLAKAKVFVLASKFEGFGMVLIEALALGANVVATDCPTGPREILEGGRWGSLVQVGDIDQLAKAMIAALDAPRLQVSREFLKPYETDTAISNYEKLMGLAEVAAMPSMGA